MHTNTLKFWFAIHKWTSLVCTVFLFLLCLTGLPLIFHHEIDHLLGNAIEAPSYPEDTPLASLDDLAAAGRSALPGQALQYMIWETGEEDTVSLTIGARADTPPDDTHSLVIDSHSALSLGPYQYNGTLTFILLKLHTDMFAGLPGKLFLGFMGLLFLFSLISGVVLYAPYMRKLAFGSIRHQRTTRIKWLDIHNLYGVATLMWMLVVGGTGVICSLADVLLQTWREDQLAKMIAPYQGTLALTSDQKLASLDLALKAAQSAVPGMKPSFIAFPGTRFSSPHHYAFFMKGNTPLTSQLWQPILIDAQTGADAKTSPLPWYMNAMMLSKPLHFGDYGGMPLKILWAFFDIITLIVLGSGLYLWWSRKPKATK